MLKRFSHIYLTILFSYFVLNPSIVFSDQDELSKSESFFVSYCELKNADDFKKLISGYNDNNSNDIRKLAELFGDNDKKKVICTCFMKAQKSAFGEEFLEATYQYYIGRISKHEVEELMPKNIEMALKNIEYLIWKCIDEEKIL
jgi:hypothetical protein